MTIDGVDKDEVGFLLGLCVGRQACQQHSSQNTQRVHDLVERMSFYEVRSNRSWFHGLRNRNKDPLITVNCDQPDLEYVCGLPTAVCRLES